MIEGERRRSALDELPLAARRRGRARAARGGQPELVLADRSPMTKLPTLWHIPISHYSEKARWALEHKGIEYRKMAPPPGAHMAIAAALTRGRGCSPSRSCRSTARPYGDSSDDHRRPRAPLPRSGRCTPRTRPSCARALELEDYFDENLGPAIRRFAWHYLTEDPELTGKALADDLPGRSSRTTASPARESRGVAVRLRARALQGARRCRSARQAKQTVLDSLDRLEAELGDREYLVGDSLHGRRPDRRLTLLPARRSARGARARSSGPPAVEDFRASQMSARRGFKWVEGIFAEHRLPAIGACARSGYQPSVPGSPFIGPSMSSVTQPP